MAGAKKIKIVLEDRSIGRIQWPADGLVRVDALVVTAFDAERRQKSKEGQEANLGLAVATKIRT